MTNRRISRMQVVPVKTGIQTKSLQKQKTKRNWIPASAGMTICIIRFIRVIRGKRLNYHLSK